MHMRQVPVDLVERQSPGGKTKRSRTVLSVLSLSLVLALLLCSIPNSQQVNAATYSWHDARGPENGDAPALAYDSARNTIYRGTTTHGIWKYQGGSWSDISGVLDGAESLAYDATHNVLYVGTGWDVWCCTNPDSSAVWKDISGTSTFRSVASLAYDSAHDVLYAGNYGTGIMRCVNPRTSTNWADIGGTSLFAQVTGLVHDTANDCLFVATLISDN